MEWTYWLKHPISRKTDFEVSVKAISLFPRTIKSHGLVWFSGIARGPPRSGPGLVIGCTEQSKRHQAPACYSKIISQGKQTTGRPHGGEAHFPLAEGAALACCRLQSPYAGNDSQKHSILADSASFQKLHPLGCRVRKWL